MTALIISPAGCGPERRPCDVQGRTSAGEATGRCVLRLPPGDANAVHPDALRFSYRKYGNLTHFM